ncbi:unnamed protein product [Lampetra planeri]
MNSGLLEDKKVVEEFVRQYEEWRSLRCCFGTIAEWWGMAESGRGLGSGMGVIGAVKEALWMARQKLIKGAYMSPPEVCRLARGLLERVVEVERATAGGAATGAKWRWPLPKCGMG